MHSVYENRDHIVELCILWVLGSTIALIQSVSSFQLCHYQWLVH